MPRPKPDIGRKPVVVRFDPALLARVDLHKGASRNIKIAELIERGLVSTGSSLPSPEDQARLKEIVRERQRRASVPSGGLPIGQRKIQNTMRGDQVISSRMMELQTYDDEGKPVWVEIDKPTEKPFVSRLKPEGKK